MVGTSSSVLVVVTSNEGCEIEGVDEFGKDDRFMGFAEERLIAWWQKKALAAIAFFEIHSENKGFIASIIPKNPHESESVWSECTNTFE